MPPPVPVNLLLKQGENVEGNCFTKPEAGRTARGRVRSPVQGGSYSGNQPMKNPPTALPLASAIVALAIWFGCGGVSGQTRLESVADPALISGGGSGGSGSAQISDDGRFVVFESAAENLTTNDGNHRTDVFLRDRSAGTTLLLSTNEGGISFRTGNSRAPTISGDGNRIAFEIPLPLPGNPTSPTHPVVRLLDRGANTVRNVSFAAGLATSAWVPATGEEFPLLLDQVSSGSPLLTSDGSRLFAGAPMVVEQPSGYPRIIPPAAGAPFDQLIPAFVVLGLVHDVQTPSINPVVVYAGNSVPSSGSSPALEGQGFAVPMTPAADGSRLAYSALFPTLSHNEFVAVFDVNLRTNTLVSVGMDGVSHANGRSYAPSISANGNRIVFVSEGANLSPADTNSTADIYLRDLTAGTTTLVSTNSSGTSNTNLLASGAPAITDDGMWTAFFSAASDLVAHDTNSLADVFLRNNSTGEISLISDHPEWRGRQVREAQAPTLTPDGSFILFQASGSGLFLHDRLAGTTIRITSDAGADQPAITPDGAFVVFSSLSSAVDPADRNPWPQVYLFDRLAGTFELISRRDGSMASLVGNESSRLIPETISPDGSRFFSLSPATSSGVAVAGRPLRFWEHTPGNPPVEVDLGSYNGTNLEPAKVGRIVTSGDGQRLLFDYVDTSISVSANAFNTVLFFRDRLTGLNQIINSNQPPRSAQTLYPAISADGTLAAFSPGGSALYTYDPTTNVRKPVIQDIGSFVPQTVAPIFLPNASALVGAALVSGGSGGGSQWIRPYLIEIPPNGAPRALDTGFAASASADRVKELRLNRAGNRVAFVLGAPSDGTNAYVVNLSPTISDLATITNATKPWVDDAGTRVAFESDVARVAGDTNGAPDVYVLETGSGQVSLVSVAANGQQAGNRGSRLLGMSPDGRFVLFRSWSDNLVAADGNQLVDLFVRDLHTQTTLLLSRGAAGAPSEGPPGVALLSQDGTRVLFEHYGGDLVAGDFNRTRDIFSATLSLPDGDNDGLPDDWELTWFDTLGRDGTGDADQDGQTDAAEFLAGTVPVANS
ncbi:MAG TPA: hypothetical protein DCY13_12685, partial [Verrucomicrobiales bacterium]|nr:hypothetical protein [Verrucomicrobiales bacterium]